MYAIFLKCFRKEIVCVFVLERERIRKRKWDRKTGEKEIIIFNCDKMVIFKEAEGKVYEILYIVLH